MCCAAFHTHILLYSNVLVFAAVIGAFLYERQRVETLAATITVPIQKMSEIANEILSHDGEVKEISDEGLRGEDDEIGWLANGFKAMLLGLGRGKKDLGGAEVKLWKENPIADDAQAALSAAKGVKMPWDE